MGSFFSKHFKLFGKQNTNNLPTDPLLSDDTFRIVKINDIKYIINDAQKIEEINITNFLKEIPLASNYVFNTSFFNDIRKFDYQTSTLNRSLNPIETHIKINNLTNTCVLGLSTKQFNMFSNIVKEVENVRRLQENNFR